MKIPKIFRYERKKIVKMNGHKKVSKRQKLKIRQIIARENNRQIESWS